MMLLSGRPPHNRFLAPLPIGHSAAPHSQAHTPGAVSRTRTRAARARVPEDSTAPSVPSVPASGSTTSQGPDQFAAASSQPVTPTQGRRRRRRAGYADPDTDNQAALVHQLVATTQLPQATAEHIVAAKRHFRSIPWEPNKLCARVQHLQRLLGQQYAEQALRRYPNLVSFSPETLAMNYRQWQTFFAPDTSYPTTTQSSHIVQQGGDDDGAAEAASGGTQGHDQHHSQPQEQHQALLQRLANTPQLLGVDVERQVGNLYEAGVLLQAQDLHEFAYKAMDLASLQPANLQDKMRRLLGFMNLALQQDQDQQQSQGQGQGQVLRNSMLSGSSASAPVFEVTLQDLAKAARKDHRWLLLSSETLQQQLLDLKTQLDAPWPIIFRMFLQQPTIIYRRPATFGQRAAALKQLPGLGPQRAASALAALPTILQVSSDKIRQRWLMLQAAARSHPMWQQRLDAMQPSTLAALLIKSHPRYERLQQVVQLGYQEHCSFSQVMSLPEQAYRDMLDKCRLKQERAAAPAPAAAAAAPVSAAASVGSVAAGAAVPAQRLPLGSKKGAPSFGQLRTGKGSSL